MEKGADADKDVFWHFTSAYHVGGCLRDGIALGVTPIRVKGNVEFLHAHQWLSSDKSFRQSWCKYSTLPYDRTAYRLRIKIPERWHHNILDYKRWRALLRGRMMPNFAKCRSAKNWFVYQGIIPRSWIVAVDKKEAGT